MVLLLGVGTMHEFLYVVVKRSDEDSRAILHTLLNIKLHKTINSKLKILKCEKSSKKWRISDAFSTGSV